MNLNDSLTLYLCRLENAGSSQSHLDSVRLRLGKFVRGREQVPVSAITGADIHTHFLRLADSGLAVATLAGHKSTHRAFWNWLRDTGHVATSPADVLRRQEHDYRAIPVNHQPADRDDFQAVVAAIPQFAANNHYSPRDVRDALAVSLSVDSSARRGKSGKFAAPIWNGRSNRGDH